MIVKLWNKAEKDKDPNAKVMIENHLHSTCEIQATHQISTVGGCGCVWGAYI